PLSGEGEQLEQKRPASRIERSGPNCGELCIDRLVQLPGLKMLGGCHGNLVGNGERKKGQAEIPMFHLPEDTSRFRPAGVTSRGRENGRGRISSTPATADEVRPSRSS